MADLIFVALIAALFAASVGLVKLCERIVGPEGTQLDLHPPADLVEERAA